MAEEAGDIELESTECWLNTLDRGGLIHISDDLYMVFYSMELEICKHFHSTTDNCLKDDLLKKILENEDLLFHWNATLSIDWEAKVSDELLKLLTEHWVTTRGFSHVCGFLELYKQEKKKTLQKSKALRNRLESCIDCD